jgi:toxin FitB
MAAIAEIEQGVCKLRRRGSRPRSDALTRWLDELVLVYGSRALPLDTVAARQAGQIADAAVAAGRHPGFADVGVAAIAAANTLVVLTRNVRHFAELGVPLIDAFDDPSR